MSYQATNAVSSAEDVNDVWELAVAMMMANKADEHGYVVYMRGRERSAAELARAARMGRSKFYEVLRALELRGVIHKFEAPTKNRPAAYRLTLKELATPEETEAGAFFTLDGEILRPIDPPETATEYVDKSAVHDTDTENAVHDTDGGVHDTDGAVHGGGQCRPPARTHRRSSKISSDSNTTPAGAREPDPPKAIYTPPPATGRPGNEQPDPDQAPGKLDQDDRGEVSAIERATVYWCATGVWRKPPGRNYPIGPPPDEEGYRLHQFNIDQLIVGVINPGMMGHPIHWRDGAAVAIARKYLEPAAKGRGEGADPQAVQARAARLRQVHQQKEAALRERIESEQAAEATYG